jgi:hypothetical protein
MFKSIGKMILFSLCCLYVSAMGPSVFAMDTGLVGLLTKSLDVTRQQAEGGAGAIFKTASQNMSVEDFAKVSDALPEATSLMDAIPSSGSGSGALGSLSSALGKSGGGVSSLAGLAGTFSQLGMGGDMVQQFIPIILDYARDKGGDVVSSLLQAALQ